MCGGVREGRAAKDEKLMGGVDRDRRIAELELKVGALAPRHIPEGRIFEEHNCIVPCPGCDYEKRVEQLREVRDS